MKYCIGLMSGTSADGLDVALCLINDESIKLVGSIFRPYSPELSRQLRECAIAETVVIEDVVEIDQIIAHVSATAVKELLEENNLTPQDVFVIGSHGHTIRHRPQPNGYSWQVGNAAEIAHGSGIDCASDFRRGDIALGGHGAPLVPLFHQFITRRFDDLKNPGVVFLNIGGIANVSIIEPDNVIGFDTGPGNALIDEWMSTQYQRPYDAGGLISSQGKVVDELLNDWLSLDYFQQLPPKSTGRELFHLDKFDNLEQYAKNDIASTLLQLTVDSINLALTQHAPKHDIFVCGGGCHNHEMIKRLEIECRKRNVQLHTVESIGLSADDMEAMAFAWLGYCRKMNIILDTPTVTGARSGSILGALHISSR